MIPRISFGFLSSVPTSFSNAANSYTRVKGEKVFFSSLKKKNSFLLIVNSRKAILKVYIFFKMLFFTALDKYHDSSDLCNRSTLQLWAEPDAGFTPNL